MKYDLIVLKNWGGGGCDIEEEKEIDERTLKISLNGAINYFEF